ncbi:hypothetical protein NUM_09710 [Actinocatenispora comari]|uniref:FtsK domain-containing protein n=1 Tax=Actinocatenispora comari TaxID=2807577 RepID=A0A8J4EI47_9ACTN|nr:hypothetical protein NUM_09710 [Actinocatenispora comari]
MSGRNKTVTERQGTAAERLFPRAAATIEFVAALGRGIGRLFRTAYLFRVELLLIGCGVWVWLRLWNWLGSPVTAGKVLGSILAVLLVLRLLYAAVGKAAPTIGKRADRLAGNPFGRALLRIAAAHTWLVGLRTVLRRHRVGRVLLWAAGMRARARVVRQMRDGLTGVRFENNAGKLPRIRKVRTTPVGERMTLVCKPGQSAELLDTRAEELRAAAKSRDVRIVRDPNRSDLVTVDVVRRDPLAATSAIRWDGLDHDALSMWDPVHIGMDENGDPVRLSMVERQIFLAGEPGSGKSSGEQVITCHAAKSPDAELLFIDPNRVQFAPWADRATAYAYADPDDALEVLNMVRAEGDRRLALLEKLPGVQRKLTREIAEGEGIPLWVLFIDELAYHTSVIGTTNGPFAKAARDIVSRFRAAGIIPVFATQRPTSDVVPTSLRDLFSMRTAYRTTTLASSDVILGEGWARQGYSATDIDLANRGVSWLLAEGALPRRVKWAWIDDETISDLSMTTVRFKPRRDPVPTPATDDTEQEG